MSWVVVQHVAADAPRRGHRAPTSGGCIPRGVRVVSPLGHRDRSVRGASDGAGTMATEDISFHARAASPVVDEFWGHGEQPETD